MDDSSLTRCIIRKIGTETPGKLNIMEVCGTHTQAISKTGIRSMLPTNITLLSGPGCPVCVTDEAHIDAAIKLLNEQDIILATFGDMMKVRGSNSSLWDQYDKRKCISVVYTPLDCIQLARENPDKQIVFFAVGFETTAPVIALSAKLAYEGNIQNLSFLTSLKLMPPVLHSILRERHKDIHGMICPGHVAAVKGAAYFRFITHEYGIPSAVCGFEALDIAAGLYFIWQHYTQASSEAFANLYKRCVSEDGNESANRIMEDVYEVGDVNWRGIGEIRNSALYLSERYYGLDALKRFGMRLEMSQKDSTCRCRDVLLGNILPIECLLFGRECTPQKPSGPCMISTEGSCLTYYSY